MGHKLWQIIGEINDVNLLVVELILNSAHPLPKFSNAGSLGVDRRVICSNGNLGAVTGFSGNLNNLNDSIGDLRNFHGKQLAN